MITILYKGFSDSSDSPLPYDLYLLNKPLHFTKYLSIAEFYGQSGFIAVYTTNMYLISEPHQDSDGPPFNFPIKDYQTIIQPHNIKLLTFKKIIKGQLLPGGFIVGPDGTTISKSHLQPKIFTKIPKYNESHFTKVNT